MSLRNTGVVISAKDIAIPAPLFGRQMLVWIVTAGGFGVVIAYTGVALSFLVLRYREPEMVRPLLGFL